MGTTLTGTTPQDTYDSLIKVTDNGPLSGTLKALSDGLGNDSTLSLSTTAASIAGTLAVTGNATFDTNTLFVDAANNRVGIGTTAPQTALDIIANSTYQLHLASNTSSYSTGGLYIGALGTADPNYHGTLAWNQDNIEFRIGAQCGNGTGGMTFFTSASNAAQTEKMRIAATGGYLRLSAASGGLQFNGDTAAANALNDYETGTWTMGVSFGGASVGVTYASNTGTYTKIGRQVTVNGLLELSNKGSSINDARITGLPFTIGNSNAYFSPPSMLLGNITFANVYSGYGEQNSTSILLLEVTVLGTTTTLTNADFANNSSIMVSFTYFV